MKKNNIQALLMSLCLLLGGCASVPESGEAAADSALPSAAVTAGPAGLAAVSAVAETAAEMFTDRDYDHSYDAAEAAAIELAGDTADSDSADVGVSGSTVTISGEGVYVLSGSLTDGSIIIDAEKSDKLQLVLNGVDINSENSAAIYVLQADKVFITLAVGTENKLSNGGSFVQTDDNNVDAVIYSKDDLSFNGAGRLIVSSPGGHGIVTKDDLVFTGGSYSITAQGHALSGKQSVRIASGVFDLSSGKDGIHAENADDAALGYVYICGGSFDIISDGDGISASNTLQIDEGGFTICSGGGSAGVTAGPSGGWSWSAAAESETDEPSAKGLKASALLSVNGGSFAIDSADDGVHSNGSVHIASGDLELSSGDDGVHANENLCVSGGSVTVSSAYEGLEGQSIDVTGGIIDIICSDDGLNAAGGRDQSGFGGYGFGGNSGFGASTDCYINISGGSIRVNASGDGIDSNGSITVSGGETYVSGPTDNGNGALDYEGSATISGGIFVAAGASGMAMNFGSASTQGAILLSFDTQAGGSRLSLTRDGSTLLSWMPEKSYGSVLISLPELTEGNSYTLSAGGYTAELTMSSLIYGSGMGGGDRGMGAMREGSMGTKPEGNMGAMPGGHGGGAERKEPAM